MILTARLRSTLFEDIADPEDWPLLISAEQKTNPRLMETIGNIDLVPAGRRASRRSFHGTPSRARAPWRASAKGRFSQRAATSAASGGSFCAGVPLQSARCWRADPGSSASTRWLFAPSAVATFACRVVTSTRDTAGRACTTDSTCSNNQTLSRTTRLRPPARVARSADTAGGTGSFNIRVSSATRSANTRPSDPSGACRLRSSSGRVS
jgi:hypothetical protein